MKAVKGKRARIMLLALLALGAFVYMRGRSQPSSLVDTGVPATDALAGGDVGTAAALEDPNSALAQLSADVASLTDQFQQAQDMALSSYDAGGGFYGDFGAFDTVANADATDWTSTGAGDNTLQPQPGLTPSPATVRVRTRADLSRLVTPRPAVSRAKAFTTVATAKKKKKKTVSPRFGGSQTTGRAVTGTGYRASSGLAELLSFSREAVPLRAMAAPRVRPTSDSGAASAAYYAATGEPGHLPTPQRTSPGPTPTITPGVYRAPSGTQVS